MATRAIRSDLPTHHTEEPATRLGTWLLALGPLGVVYGDIGTSPLYAFKECFRRMPADPENVLGVLSLIFWSLTVVISVKYLTFILRADNDGEGGTFALLALIRQARPPLPRLLAGLVTLLAMVGAALLYGDGIITPAISVLSAVEGLSVVTQAAERAVVPLTCAILFGLFFVQKRGTRRIAGLFGPVMLTWFMVIAVIGVAGIARHPSVLLAVSPHHALVFLVHHGTFSLVVLGSVVLCVTGGEALYADMGHFARRPMQRAWFWLVFPALLLNYFGQGALVLVRPEATENPFFSLVPPPLVVPLVVLATAATVIASQALITGVFSLTRQAIQFDVLPRFRVVHTSEAAEGQIYLPGVNYGLMVLCLLAVAVAGSSSRLASAYGLAVTANMAITSLLFFIVATRTWRRSVRRVAGVVGLFLVFDIAFLGSTMLKVGDGGWFPLVIAAIVVTAMLTWRAGRAEVARRFDEQRTPLPELMASLAAAPPVRVPGTAVFMTASTEGAPVTLLHHLRLNQVLHEQVVLFSVIFQDVPRVRSSQQIKVEAIGQGFYRLHTMCGFMETPYVPDIMHRARSYGLPSVPATTTYFLGRETYIAKRRAEGARWRKRLFAFMARNAYAAMHWYGIPPHRVIELGIQVEI